MTELVSLPNRKEHYVFYDDTNPKNDELTLHKARLKLAIWASEEHVEVNKFTYTWGEKYLTVMLHGTRYFKND